MSYVIYGAPGSGSGIVEAACAEIGVSYEVRDLDAKHGEHLREHYQSINPHRKMPTLELDTGEIITESVAILLTLDERHPEARLLPPPSSVERAQALRWMLFLATELYPLVEMIDYPERFVLSHHHADEVRTQAKHLQHKRWQIVESNVAASPFCMASGFSAIDIYLTKMSVWLDENWRHQNLPKVDTITHATLKRPSLANVWARHVR